MMIWLMITYVEHFRVGLKHVDHRQTLKIITNDSRFFLFLNKETIKVR